VIRHAIIWGLCLSSVGVSKIAEAQKPIAFAYRSFWPEFGAYWSIGASMLSLPTCQLGSQ